MAKKEYFGRIKYLGNNSTSQLFKSAIVVLYEEPHRCILKTHLKCNPYQVYKSNEITDAQVLIKGGRLIIRYRYDAGFGELHYLSENKENIKHLHRDIQDIQYKIVSRSKHQNKAEVGRGRKMSHAPSQAPLVGLLPPEMCKKPCESNGSSGGEQLVSAHSRRLPGGSGGSEFFPGFTAVKESKPAEDDADTEMPSDDESKENHYRGPLGLSVDKQSAQVDRKPLQPSVYRFYGSSTPVRPLTTAVPKTYARASRFKWEEKKSGQFTDMHSTWNSNRTSTPAPVKKLMPPLQGFANLGNTCYMNAILQSLFSLDTFHADLCILYRQWSRRSLDKEALIVALAKLMVLRSKRHIEPQKVEQMLKDVKRAISTTAKRFSGNEQHDAHEFLGQVLDQVKEEVIQVTKEEKPDITRGSPSSSSTPSSAASSEVVPIRRSASVDDTAAGTDEPAQKSPLSAEPLDPATSNFEFELAHSFKCRNCHQCSVKVEQYNNMSMEIPATKHSGTNLSLQDALDVSLQKEEIDHRCEKCGDPMAEVTHKFAKLPRILILHLKRYSYDLGSHKVQEDLQLPRFITLQEHCDTSTIPHLPHQLSSFKDLPTIPTPTKSPDGNHRHVRRKLSPGRETSEKENSWKSPKKVRRSLLAEVDGAAADIPNSKGTSCGDEMQLAVQESENMATKPPVREYEVEIDLPGYDEQLQQALSLSMKEYEAKITSPNQDFAGAETSNNSGDAEIDLSKLSEAEQIELAISLSLGQKPSTPPGLRSSSGQLRSTSDSPVSANGRSVFKKPVSGPESFMEESKKCLDQSRNRRAASEPASEARFFSTSNGLISFVRASDFMSESGAARANPESNTNEDSDKSASDSVDGAFPSCRRDSSSPPPPYTLTWAPDEFDSDWSRSRPDGSDSSGKEKSLPGVTERSSHSSQPQLANFRSGVKQANSGVSRKIGSIGCMSASQCVQTASEPEFTEVIHLDLIPDSDLKFSDEGEGDGDLASTLPCTESRLTPAMSKMDTTCRNKTSPLSPVGASASEVRSWDKKRMATAETEEESPVSPVMRTKLFQNAESCLDQRSKVRSFLRRQTTPEKDGKRDAEEKENLTPPDGMSGDDPETPPDKEAEDRALARRVRLTEIEKGLFPLSYRLVSIVNHFGQASGFGHYVSDVYDVKKQQWHSYDDSKVERTTEPHVRTQRTSTGYIFFYLSKDIFDDITDNRPEGKRRELSEKTSV